MPQWSGSVMTSTHSPAQIMPMQPVVLSSVGSPEDVPGGAPELVPSPVTTEPVEVDDSSPFDSVDALAVSVPLVVAGPS